MHKSFSVMHYWYRAEALIVFMIRHSETSVMLEEIGRRDKVTKETLARRKKSIDSKFR